MTKTTFNELPERMDILLREVQELKEIILKKMKQPKEVPKYLSLDDAVIFLASQGYKLSKSAIYKKSSLRTIPFTRFNGKLLFNTQDLRTWCEHQLTKK
ncbi:hypothetical protein E2605_04270 [Dysgonomonas capnocytophagoides]|uniref:DNA-binding protein n=1 Tax=Dysgonomonas capnocytophagoides TaxID=45254 RepID=A0A4Y8L6Z4_9BACT|nr:hypothetical protein [Dysgonomonas capnocytophagoides]TFD97838.1 hypothetical protein E2605_04270 [Dysgonomonas capnocytophagoides]